MIVDHPSDVELKARRAMSKLLFGGAQYRLEIGAAIARARLVSTMELASELGLSRQSVNKELHILRDAGLLEEAEHGTGRQVFFNAAPSGYWAWCVEAARDSEAMLKRASPF